MANGFEATLARVLFIGTGAALGAVTGLALSQVLWPTAALLLALGGACCFGLIGYLADQVGVSAPATRLGAARRWVLLLALALFMLTVAWMVAIGTSSRAATAVLRHSTFARTLGCLFIVDGASAVIITELFRVTIARTSRWPDRLHFISVCVVWVAIFTFSAYFLGRVWPKLGLP